MSILGCRLMEKRYQLEEEKGGLEKDYRPLLSAIFGEQEFDPALNQNQELFSVVDDILYELDQSNPFGTLQQYVLQEHFLYGKSREEIGQEIAQQMDILLNDLINPAIRFLRHPSRSKDLQNIIRGE